MNKFFVREAKFQDIDDIVKIHIEAFKGFFLTSLGNEFLEEYYSFILKYPYNIFLVCLDNNNKVVGFVAGFMEPNQFYAKLKKEKIKFGFIVIKAIFKNIKILFSILQRYKQVKEFSQEREKESVELASVAVNPMYSGKGIGKMLVYAFLKEAENLGAKYVYLTTDAVNNEKVNKFYENLGFKIFKTYKTPSGRLMNEYRYYFNVEVRNEK